MEFRLLCFITLRNWYSTWLVLPVEFLTGMGFALTWSASLLYCNKVAPAKDKLLVTVRDKKLFKSFNLALNNPILYANYMRVYMHA